MPGRNTEKQYVEQSFYHLYGRGVNMRPIFLVADDYAVFLNLLKRYLDDKPAKDNKGREYDWLHERIELLAFCLMPNHFHLLVYQHDSKAVTRLMRGVLTSYTVYFNKKYKRVGPLFQSVFKASQIISDEYLLHISRYIHLNPKQYKTWEYSSLPYYRNKKSARWVRTKRITDLFKRDDYMTFLRDHEDYKQALADIKSELANDI